jgi:hypothetical protein
MTRKCKMCKTPLEGRADKVFCSANCKAYYHIKLTKVTNSATALTDKILHRNRSTLLEIMGKKVMQKKVKRELLDIKKFNWHYITSYHVNAQNIMVHYIYDFSWMIFSDQEILIKRVGEK